MKYCSNKEIDQMIRQLLRQGWRFRRGSKHGRLTHPSGWPTVTVASSPSDWRSLQNFHRDLRQARASILGSSGAESGVVTASRVN